METAKSTATKWLTSWQFWLVIAIIILSIYSYKKGVNDKANEMPDVVPYPDTYQTDAQKAQFDTWAKTDGLRIVTGFGDFYSTWRIVYVKLSLLVIECNKLSDNQLVYINTLYNKKFYKLRKGSLVKDLESDILIVGNGAYKDFAKKLRNLGAK
jgi:hypothetical protein